MTIKYFHNLSLDKFREVYYNRNKVTEFVRLLFPVGMDTNSIKFISHHFSSVNFACFKKNNLLLCDILKFNKKLSNPPENYQLLLLQYANWDANCQLSD